MARWRLAAPHYLNVEGTKWEYSEVDRVTGRPKRTQFPVPTPLDPDNPGDWNYRYGADSGEIIVSDGIGAEPKDIVFAGDPTPDMVALDDAARAKTEAMRPKWKHPIESLTTSYADAMLKDLSEEVAQVRAAGGGTAQVEGMTELLTGLAGMMKQNQDILSALVASKQAAPVAGVRK